MASNFARFESIWLQLTTNTAREGVQNTYHWSGSIDDPTHWWMTAAMTTWSSLGHSVLSCCVRPRYCANLLPSNKGAPYKWTYLLTYNISVTTPTHHRDTRTLNTNLEQDKTYVVIGQVDGVLQQFWRERLQVCKERFKRSRVWCFLTRQRKPFLSYQLQTLVLHNTSGTSISANLTTTTLRVFV